MLNLEPLRGELRRALLRGPDQEGQIVALRRVHGSRPVFAGTRIPVATIQRLVAQGLTDDEVMQEYPRLTASDLGAVRAG